MNPKILKIIYRIILAMLVGVVAGYFLASSHVLSPAIPPSQTPTPTIPANPTPTPVPAPNPTTTKPLVVDYFACGDYCPGPREKYLIKVYQGITDSAECLKLGGTPGEFTGWGVSHYCEVK